MRAFKCTRRKRTELYFTLALRAKSRFHEGTKCKYDIMIYPFHCKSFTI